MIKKYLLVMVLLISLPSQAAIMHGIFSGHITNSYFNNSFLNDVSNGDAFELRFEIDANTSSFEINPHIVELTVNGQHGTFGNAWVSGQSCCDLTMNTVLDSPLGVFNGAPYANIEFQFTGLSSVFSTGAPITSAFSLSQLIHFTGGFDDGNNSAQFVFTSGSYSIGGLPAIPVPGAILLYLSAIFPLVVRCFNKAINCAPLAPDCRTGSRLWRR